LDGISERLYGCLVHSGRDRKPLVARGAQAVDLVCLSLAHGSDTVAHGWASPRDRRGQSAGAAVDRSGEADDRVSAARSGPCKDLCPGILRGLLVAVRSNESDPSAWLEGTLVGSLQQERRRRESGNPASLLRGPSAARQGAEGRGWHRGTSRRARVRCPCSPGTLAGSGRRSAGRKHRPRSHRESGLSRSTRSSSPSPYPCSEGSQPLRRSCQRRRRRYAFPGQDASAGRSDASAKSG
jgi:hypothetical protein